MIASITGPIIYKALDHVVVEAGGLGYKVFVTSSALEAYAPRAVVTLLTHLVVREDSQALYGFVSREELSLFGKLLGVSGVGPRMALAIISSGQVADLISAISRGDSAIFTTISGIGKKTAERIIVELKSSVIDLAGADGGQDSSDIIEALVSLGYNRHEIRSILNQIPASVPLDAKLKEALKLLG